MAEKKEYKLDLTSVLNAIDRKDTSFYDRLSPEERKGYSPLVLMRYMSSLTAQNPMAPIAVLATNDLVNIGFWDLNTYPDLQHLLLCITGQGGKQYRPWIPMAKARRSSKIDVFLMSQHPDANDDEIDIIKAGFTTDTWAEYIRDSGLSDVETKELINAWKKKKDK